MKSEKIQDMDEERNPHDVLAAEAFVLPAPDPRLAGRDAHDVLAAEEFVLPAPDPRLTIHGQPLALPPDPKDPAGVEPARDVLAAEEFAMPAPVSRDAADGSDPADARRRIRSRGLMGVAALALLVRRRLRRQRLS